MIDKKEISRILDEVTNEVRSECGNITLSIAEYDVTLEGRYGMGHICSLSIDR